MNVITSKENQNIKDVIRLLSSRKIRRDEGLFVVEGVRACVEIYSCNQPLEKLFVTQEAIDKYGVALAPLLQTTIDTYIISQEVGNKLAETKNPQGVFGVFRGSFSPATLRKGGNYLLLCSLQDPGNLGTIFRSCDAFSLDGLLLTEDCVDIYTPKVLRATMGTLFRVPVQQFATVEEATIAIKAQGIPLYAAALSKQAMSIEEVTFQNGGCVMIGNEGRGLTEDEISLADSQIIIPMNQQSESLNAGVAASIFAWEMRKNKR